MNWIKQNWFKVGICGCLLILTAGFLLYVIEKSKNDTFYKNLKCNNESERLPYFYNKKTNRCELIRLPKMDLPNCNFEIQDLKEYKGQYGERQFFYIIYEGLIRNKSNKKEHLKAMVAKVYNEADIYLTEGYTEIGTEIEPNKAIPFKINTTLDTVYSTEIRKYFNESKSFKPDIYPWFTTCK